MIGGEGDSSRLSPHAGNCCSVKIGVGGGWHFDGCLRVGEVEDVLWAVRAELLGVMEHVSGLINKVDMGYGLWLMAY